jgi:hypothetical protein
MCTLATSTVPFSAQICVLWPLQPYLSVHKCVLQPLKVNTQEPHLVDIVVAAHSGSSVKTVPAGPTSYRASRWQRQHLHRRWTRFLRGFSPQGSGATPRPQLAEDPGGIAASGGGCGGQWGRTAARRFQAAVALRYHRACGAASSAESWPAVAQHLVLKPREEAGRCQISGGYSRSVLQRNLGAAFHQVQYALPGHRRLTDGQVKRSVTVPILQWGTVHEISV